MLTKDQFIDSLVHEIAVIRHLGKKIEPSMLNYRPTEKQRTMLELLNYLGHIFTIAITANIAGDTALYTTLRKDAPQVTLETFDAAMEAQEKLVREKIGALSEDDLKRETEIFGNKTPLALHLLNVLKWSVAYKMQLFLYMKATGKHELNTMNLWRGMDTPPKE
jgi:hypothetical protein